jgi:hypothetical protein
MNNLDLILDECLTRLASGASSVEECLVRYPEQAAQLKPLLHTAAIMERNHIHNIQPSPAFKSRARAQLTAHMQDHPRRRIGPFSRIRQVAISLAVVVMAFMVTGTAFAQDALPGQPLYAWKLSSERTWRAVAPDPIAVDLSLARRRLAELKAVGKDPEREAQALEGYQTVLARLKSENNGHNEDRILEALKAHREQLFEEGVTIPELDDYLAPSSDSNPPANSVPARPDPAAGSGPFPTAEITPSSP